MSLFLFIKGTSGAGAMTLWVKFLFCMLVTESAFGSQHSGPMTCACISGAGELRQALIVDSRMTLTLSWFLGWPLCVQKCIVQSLSMCVVSDIMFVVGSSFILLMSKFIFIKVCHALRPLMWSTFKASCTTTKSLFAICYVSVCYFLLTRGLMHFWSFFVTAFYFARPV